MSEGDAIRPLRNYFHLGLYDQCISESKQVKGSSDVLAAAEVYAFRSLLAKSPEDVSKATPSKASTAVQAITQTALYMASTDEKDMIFDTLKNWLEDEILKNDPTLLLMVANIHMEEKDYKSALKLLQNPGENLEKCSLIVQIYLRMNRVDLAAKEMKAMQEIDDDDTLTQLAVAWVNLALGGDKVTEATFVLQELQEKFGPSVRVFNMLAACQMRLKDWTAAVTYLKQAREQALSTKTKVAAETLINTIICLQHLKKPAEIITKINGELKASYPTHPWVVKQAQAEALFDTTAASFK